MLPEFTIQWFPGHMQKAKRNMRENLKLVDLIIEVRDARAPLASANPTLTDIGEHKERLILLNKADLAEEKETTKWLNIAPNMLSFSGKDSRDVKRLERDLDQIGRKLKNEWQSKNRGLRPYRALVLGMPNVGKSTIINALSRSSKAKTGEKPGVTRGKQWITLANNWQLLDTPGVMVPEAVKGDSALFLALINAVEEKLYDQELAVLHFISWMLNKHPEALASRYKIEIEDCNPLSVLELIGKRRGCLQSGGYVDYSKVAFILLKDFREGEFGRISLETIDN